MNIHPLSPSEAKNKICSLGIKQTHLAKKMLIGKNYLNEILNEKRKSPRIMLMLTFILKEYEPNK